MSGAPVAIDPATLGELVAFALNAIDDETGCCPHCCAPCHALKTLLDFGSLDYIADTYAQQVGGGWSWWVNDRVDRERLDRAWRLTTCHDG